MAEKESDALFMDTSTFQFSELMYNSTNLEHHLCKFILSGRRKITILLGGKTGVGKSRLTNALIGEKLAKEGEELDPQTDDVSYFASKFMKHSGRGCRDVSFFAVAAVGLVMDARVDFTLASTDLTLQQSQFHKISVSYIQEKMRCIKLYYINVDPVIHEVFSRYRKMAR